MKSFSILHTATEYSQSATGLGTDCFGYCLINAGDDVATITLNTNYSFTLAKGASISVGYVPNCVVNDEIDITVTSDAPKIILILANINNIS